MQFPDFDPVLLQIGPIAIRWYALAYVAGILLGWRYVVGLTRNLGLWRGALPSASDKHIDDLVLWITLGIIVGGRLGYILFYKPELIWTDPLEILRTWNGGMSFHGGLIGVCLAIAVFAWRNKIDILRLGDLVAPCVPIGLFFGRLANFINGELWGRPTTAPWGIIFPRAGPEPRHPSQLYEAGLEGLILFLVLRWATHSAKLLPRRGAVTGLFLIGYSLSRIALENVREPDRDMPNFPLGLTMGMMLSIPMLVIGVWLFLQSRRPSSLAVAVQTDVAGNRLKAEIAAHGPINVAQYMTRCLHDPQDGYYATRPALGMEGDFITAPLVSQMFGELLGLWAAETWARLGAPARFRLVEMGPGDGTLMSDAVRALSRAAPEALEAADLWLVETSAPLKVLQRQALGDRPRWAASLADVPSGAPIVLIANELLDCLPARQFVRVEGGWAERWVGLDETGALAFGLQPLPGALDLGSAPPGSILERSEAQAALGADAGARIAVDGGAALFIDYGRDAPGYGDTLQALVRHEKVSPLERPGEADLTVHADFPLFVEAARTAGAEASPILGQGEFLKALGIEARASALMRARPEGAEKLARQLARLVEPDQMGALFKAVAIHSHGVEPPGFEA